jgi:hypothetical protein
MLFRILLMIAALSAALLLTGCPAGDETAGGTDAGTSTDGSPEATEEPATE